MRDDALAATAPTVVFEAPSPSTRTFDQLRKVDEYKRIETMRHIVLIDPDQPRAVLWTRDASGWRDDEIDDPDDVLEPSAIAVSLPMADVYAEVEFDEAG